MEKKAAGFAANDPYFGTYLRCDRAGTIRVGDPVYILKKKTLEYCHPAAISCKELETSAHRCFVVNSTRTVLMLGTDDRTLRCFLDIRPQPTRRTSRKLVGN